MAKKKNPKDATVHDLVPLKKRLDQLESRVTALEDWRGLTAPAPVPPEPAPEPPKVD